MARKRRWASSRRRKAHTFWITDNGQGLAAPTTGVADNDNICSSSDYGSGILTADKEKVRILRILFEVWWNPVGVNATDGAAFFVDMLLLVSGADQMGAAMSASVDLNGWYTLDARVIRGVSKSHVEGDQATAVGAWQPRQPPRWSVNLRTNFLMTEPESLYFYQRKLDTDSTSDSYEYSYRSRLLCQRVT